MKPEDVVVGEKFPALGEKGGFAAPYETDGAASGVFLFADGSVRSLPTGLDQQMFLNLLHIADGNVIGELPGAGRAKPRPGVRTAQFIEIVGSGNDVRARLVVGEE
jgi:hypothetical protein